MNNSFFPHQQYNMILRNDNVHGIKPLEFKHYLLSVIVSSFNKTNADPCSVNFSGTARNSKTYLCRNMIINGKMNRTLN